MKTEPEKSFKADLPPPIFIIFVLRLYYDRNFLSFLPKYLYITTTL